MRRRAACTLPLLALLPGCAARREIAVDASFFPHPQRTDGQTPGRGVIQVPPAVRDLVHEGDDGPARSLRIPIGRIVARALQEAVEDAFSGGAMVLDAPARPDAAVMLALNAVRVSYRQHLAWAIPLPLIGTADFEFDVQLAFDASLVDAQGPVAWTRTYDDGRRVWPHTWSEQHQAADGLMRLTHEAAWRLAQRAVGDLREGVQADRMRPRRL